MNIKQFNFLAQTNPLAITDEMVAVFQEKTRVFKRNLKIVLRTSAFLMFVFMVSAYWMLIAPFTHIDNFIPVVNGALGMALIALCLTPFFQVREKHHNAFLNQTHTLSEMDGSECADVIHLCQYSPRAEAFRDAVINAGQPLRLFHLFHMKTIVESEKMARYTKERSAACRAAHGMNETKQATQSTDKSHVPIVALGALALLAVVFNK